VGWGESAAAVLPKQVAAIAKTNEKSGLVMASPPVFYVGVPNRSKYEDSRIGPDVTRAAA
jgi:hypothetical protein